MAGRPPEPESTLVSVGERLTLAAAEAQRTMRGRASRALAGVQGRARTRRRVLQVGMAGLVVLLVLVLAAAFARMMDPPLPPEDRLASAIAAGDREAVVALLGDGALAALEASSPTEAVRLAIDGCDVVMFRLLTGAGARRTADTGRAAQDVALTTAIRRCPPPVIREVWSDTRSATPPLHLMVFAAVEGGPGAVRALAHLGLPVEAPLDDPDGPSPLEAAIRAGRADVARSLVALGADPERRTAEGTSLAHLLRAIPDAAGCAAMAPGERDAWRVACAAYGLGGRP